MKVEVLHAKSGKSLAVFTEVDEKTTIGDLKRLYQQHGRVPIASQVYYKAAQRGSKKFRDEDHLSELDLQTSGGDDDTKQLFFKNLGPQVSWTTVFLTEYSGPLVLYLFFYARPSIIYGSNAGKIPYQVVNLAAACWTLHYAKRLWETIFVHRFSNATMPIANIFKNSVYYWGFAAWVAYYTNHPLYTPPASRVQMYVGLVGMLIGELGNLSIHMALRDLRPPGTKERRIPHPTSNPFTFLFDYVACPNYTYEFIAWMSFTIMTQTVPALVFAVAGMIPMTLWAQGKRRNYIKEFDNYPRERKAILPFIL